MSAGNIQESIIKGEEIFKKEVWHRLDLPKVD